MNIILKFGQVLSYIMMSGCALWGLCIFANVLFNDIARKKVVTTSKPKAADVARRR